MATDDAPDSVSEASTSPTLSKASLNITNDSDRSGRLAKDRTESADENSDSADSSDEADISSEEEDVYDIRKGPVGPRGRSKSPRGRSKTKPQLSPGTSPARSPAPPGGWSGKRGPGPLPPGSPRVGGALSLFNELNEEEELNGPIVTHRRANGRRTVLSPGPRKSGVHPHTSFDHNGSGLNTPVGSDEEADLSDIKQAQNLSIHLSSVDTTIPDRAIRTIIRGDFPRLQQEAEEGFRRQRSYLVATDLSEESVYALEWTIGTILRDGDTLFAVYAVADENASGVDLNTGVQIGDGATVIKHTTDIVGKQTEKTAQKYQNSSSATTSLLPNALAAYFGGTDSKVNSRTNSVDARALSRSEQERIRAIEDISNTCVRLLRKTMLQVRVAVEVIHCKSPKHLLTEAIDGLEPTLVILGSRGRSALKGVLLGSFSNYLVTKSSVPVMVARKKLKKHTKNARIRLSNNLTTPRGLAGAKID
jgi:nucleotide-binding universal stress UspA family protein